MILNFYCIRVDFDLVRYALVNIVMGDIADIEKKKSKGLSSLLLGAKPNQMVQVKKIFF